MKLLQIHEHLQGVKKYHNLNWEQFKRVLHTKGIVYVGTGSFGDVFDCPRWNYVIKVFEHDSAYLHFVNHVMANPSPSFPKFKKQVIKIHQFHTRPSNTPKFLYAVRIEKLKSAEGSVPNQLFSILHFYGQALIDVTRVGMMDFVFELTAGNLTTEQMFKKYEKYQLKELIQSLVHYVDSKNFEFGLDLRPDNFMLRGNTLVCIDPVFGDDVEEGVVIQGLFRASRTDKEYTYNTQSDTDISGPIYDALLSM